MSQPLSSSEPAAASLTGHPSARAQALALLPPALLVQGCWLALLAGFPTLTQPWPFQALFALAFAGYCWALLAALPLARLSARAQAGVVLSGAFVFHLTLLFAPHAFSDDVFRYVWDGRVSAAGIDPYRYAPGAPELAPLRDGAIWPAVNAKSQPSPYPPLLEAFFALIYRIRPESVLAMKVAVSLLNMAVIGLLLLLLRARGQPPIRALIYAWSPQVVFQVALSGHNEPLLLACLLGGLLVGGTKDEGRGTGDGGRRTEDEGRRTEDRGRGTEAERGFGRQWSLVGGRWSVVGRPSRLIGAWLLGLATLAKVVPLIMLPVLVRRWGWRAGATFLATVGAVYAALLLRGQRLFDGVAVEVGEAQFNDGAHYLFYWLARLVDPALAQRLAGLAAAGLLGLVLLALLRERSRDMLKPAGTLLAAYVALAASVAPWYALWILPFVALDALPPLPGDQRGSYGRLLGGYWLIFSWTATFSELYYAVGTPVWRVVHIAEYLVPLAVMVAAWLWARRAAPRSA